LRSEEEMYALILHTAREDERIRAVILNGSRTNPQAPSDIFQDFDVIYLVTEMDSFKRDGDWIKRFGELMILQLPDDMGNPPPGGEPGYAYLMQFADGNRIDLCLYPIARLRELKRDSLSVLLLDKDGVVEPFPPPNENDYLPKLPTRKAFEDCCNEFWWVSIYVAKGLWRGEIIYAKAMLDQLMREQLMKMLVWYIGVKTRFSVNLGKFGKNFQRYLEAGLWEMLQRTYADADYERNWDALMTACELFRIIGRSVGEHFGFDYLEEEDERVSAHLRHVRQLPKTAKSIY
jgi:aminoglycoside 6-adenylyltransferase